MTPDFAFAYLRGVFDATGLASTATETPAAEALELLRRDGERWREAFLDALHGLELALENLPYPPDGPEQEQTYELLDDLLRDLRALTTEPAPSPPAPAAAAPTPARREPTLAEVRAAAQAGQLGGAWQASESEPGDYVGPLADTFDALLEHWRERNRHVIDLRIEIAVGGGGRWLVWTAPENLLEYREAWRAGFHGWRADAAALELRVHGARAADAIEAGCRWLCSPWAAWTADELDRELAPWPGVSEPLGSELEQRPSCWRMGCRDPVLPDRIGCEKHPHPAEDDDAAPEAIKRSGAT